MSIATTESNRTAIPTPSPSRRTASRATITRLEARRRGHVVPESTQTRTTLDPIALYDSLCATCHGYPTDSADAVTCPSCGIASTEYALSLTMGEILDDMAHMEKLLDAVMTTEV